MQKKVPMRMCVVCRTMLPKAELLRIVRTDEGVRLDFTGKANGRGAYICNKPECIDKCVKKRVLDRVFAAKLDDGIYAYIKEEYAKHSQDN